MSRLFICLIKFYQKTVSPRKIPCCRFTPSCSAYAIEALSVHGPVKGTAYAVWRILRCNPFCRGGYDPVPEKKTKKSHR
ncbi:MAG: membrane protein insertion efficiency factor YidD [Clostridia bacterium]|nr:membrane protein insertion efficiency factor YidD [Clostridia bacterium]